MNDPRSIVDRNGRPKSRKGCFCSDFRYFAASEFGSVALKDLEVKGPGMAAVLGVLDPKLCNMGVGMRV